MGQNGISLLDAFADAKIDPSILKDREARISTRKFNMIWEEAVRRIEDANMGLRFGQKIANAYFKGNILSGMMANASNLAKAIEIFCRYHILSEDAILPKMKIKDDLAFLSWETASHHFQTTRQISEALLCAYVKILRSITDDNLKLLEVRFQHKAPADVQGHRDIFLAPLRFNEQKNEMVIEKTALDLPVFFSRSNPF